ncbi:MAG: succinate dehydrogenase flavoprotein subunit, partial [Bacteroidetes bacterium HGW-Bacteroidetes-22]
LLSIKGKQSVDTFHRKLGIIMWENVGMGRNEAGLKLAIEKIQLLREEFWKDVRVVGSKTGVNQELEKALRLIDYLELGELMARDALLRNESCGGHFREEYQTEDGEALRDDQNYKYVSAWEYKPGDVPEKHIEPLNYEFIEVKTRNYKV